MKPVRMREVATRAGVSEMTVSRALRTPDAVAPRTLERVQRAVEELGYVPDLAAGSLSSKRNRFIVALVPLLNSSPFADTLQSLSSELHQEGYQLLMGTTDYSLKREEELIQALLGHRPQAIVVTGRHHGAETRRRLDRAQVPVVEIWDLPDQPIDSAVGYSNFACGVALTEYLHARGRRRIGFAISGMRDDDRGEQRLQGYRETVQRLGLEEVVERVGQPPIRMEYGRQVLRQLQARVPDLDAVICVSDTLAIGVLSEAREQGLDLPSQLAVAGFGDFEVAQHTHPSLTTIRVSGREIGRKTAELLLRRLEGADQAPHIVDVSFQLIERNST